MVKKVLVGIAMFGVLGLGMPVFAGEVALPKTPEDLLAMTDAIRAAPTLDFLNGARLYRYTKDGGLKLLKDGDGPWNFIATVPADLAPLALDDLGLQWLKAMLTGTKPELERPGVGFVWAGTRLADHKTGKIKRDIPPSVMVLWPFAPKTTGLTSEPQVREVRIMLPNTPYTHWVVPMPGITGLYGKETQEGKEVQPWGHRGTWWGRHSPRC